MNSRSIYLHIFDREFRSFTNSKLTDDDACKTVLVASLLSSSPYAGMGNLLESQSDLPKAVELFYELEKLQEATIVSSSSSPDDFIEGRKKLYYDDKDRYPMYFKSKGCLLLPKNSIPLSDSTTDILEERLARELREENAPKNLKNATEIRKAILNHDESGITLGIIGRHTTLNSDERKWLGLQISKAYTNRYMKVLEGCLIKGIPNVSIVLDDLSKAYFYFNLYNPFFHGLIFRHLSFNKGAKAVVEQLARIKQEVGYWDLVDLYNEIICSLFEFYIKGGSLGNEYFIAIRCQNIAKRYIFPRLSVPKVFNVQQNLFLLREAAQKIEETEKIGISMNQDNATKKMLYFVATDTEYNRVYEYYKKKNGFNPGSTIIGDYIYRDLGVIGNTHVYLLKSSMGAKGNNGSIIAVNEAERSLKPDFIIMVGIGFGLKEEEQKLGDIMVSEAIEDYGTCKVREGDVIQRGNRIPSDAILKNRFSDSKLEWGKSSIHSGLIITNDVLVNDNSYVAWLKQHFPDAIGGEMEGCGLLANYQTPWILIKGICDFGHDKSNEYQELAATNAIEYVDFTLERSQL